MANTRPIVLPLVRAITQAIAGDDAVSRNFTTLDSAFAKHYTIPTWTAAGDFSISFSFSTTSTSGLNMIVGNSVDASTFIYVYGPEGSVVCRAPVGKQIVSTTTMFNDGKLYSGVFSRTSGNLELIVSGVSEGTNTGSVGDAVIDVFGRNAFGNYFNGVEANIGLNEAGGDNRFYAVDEDWVNGPVLRNSLATLGSELVVNGDFSNGLTGWSDTSEAGGSVAVVSESLELTSASGASGDRARIVTSIPTEIGRTYIYSYSKSGGGLNLRAGTSSQNNNTIPDRTAPDGDNTLTFTANGATTYFNWYGVAAGTAVLDDFSVRQADGYGTAVNITSADSDPYLFDGAVSPNTWTNQNPPLNVIEVAGT